MNFFKKTIEETLQELKVDKITGLSDKQVEENIKEHGLNKITPPKKDSFIKRIIDSLKDFTIIILIASAFLSIILSLVNYAKGGKLDFESSIGIICAVILSASIQLIMEGKSDKAFQKLSDINDDIKTKVLRNGKVEYILKQNLTIGDIIFLETGDKVPADCRLIEGLDIKVNESMLTGESDNVTKKANLVLESEETPLAERKNMLYSGCYIVEGRGKAIITDIGDNTEMGKIAEELKNPLDATTPLQEKLDKLGKQISVVGSVLAGLIFVLQLIKFAMTGEITFLGVETALVTAIALIVAAVPEGLPTMVAITLSINMMKMAKNNSLVKKLVACETVGSTTVICSDKTGTLTKNQMTVLDVWNNGSLTKPEDMKSGHMIENFCINSTAHLQLENGKVEFIGNPTECSLLEAFTKSICSHSPTKCSDYCDGKGICKKTCSKYIDSTETIKDYNSIRNSAKITHQYAFSSDRKSMTTVIENEEGLRVYSKGSPEKILSLCKKVIINGEIVELTKEIQEKIEKDIVTLQEDARRIIGFAYKDIEKTDIDYVDSQEEVESDLIFTGFVGIADPLRDDVIDAIEDCRKAHIDLKMLTGDNIITATSIAKQLGMLTEGSLVYEANDIDKMSDEELKQKIHSIKVIARSKPVTKMRVVKALKEIGEVVAVTGDGINDAPALKNADVGIAMGIAGTEVSKEASDIVLLDDSFSTIVKSVNWGRAIYENFQRFIQFQLTVNIVAFLTALVSVLLGFAMPFTTIQLLWVNIIMDGPPALSLGLEPPRKHLMEKKPIKRNASIINKDMLFKIISNGLFISGMLLFLILTNPLGVVEEQKSTVIFTSFVLFQLFNSFNSREFGHDSIFSNLLKNKIMFLILTITFGIQILITQFGGGVFKTVPLSLDMWLKMFAYSFSVIIFSEIVKLFMRVIKK